MKISLGDFLVLFVLSVFTFNLTNGECNVCQENHVACVNETSYHMCYGGTKPNTDQLFTCPDGLVCTNLPNICFQRSTIPASCGDTTSCDKCNSDQVFACTSRTTFAFCFGSPVPSDVSGSCPWGQVCDASSPDFCVSESKPGAIICDKENTSVPSFRNKIFYFNRKNYEQNFYKN